MKRRSLVPVIPRAAKNYRRVGRRGFKTGNKSLALLEYEKLRNMMPKKIGIPKSWRPFQDVPPGNILFAFREIYELNL